MAVRVSTPKPTASGWRFAAGALLIIEALWWAGNTGIVVFATFGLSATAELLAIVPVALMVMTLLAVFLLIQAPRGGIWVGLVLQGIIFVHGLVLLFPFASLIGAFELPLAVTTALCLAAAASERMRRRE